MLVPGAASTDIHMKCQAFLLYFKSEAGKKKSWKSTKARRGARGCGEVWGYDVLVSKGEGVKLHPL